MGTHDGGMLYRCPEIEDLDLTLEATRCGHEPTPFCSLADYLGIGTGQLAAYTVTDHSTGESYARFYWWQPPMLVARPFRHARAGI